MSNNVGIAFTNPSIISNCTGLVRGIERGIERVIGPVNILAYVEIEAFAITNLVAQMESGLLAPRPIWTNLKTFPAQHFYGKVHAITGGYPCQPFSCAGQRQGTEDPRHLWPFIEFQMSAIRPVWGFFENVGDHLSFGFDTVYRSLRRMGYRVEAGIYTAEEAGAPHERERLFILAVVDDPEIRTIGINFNNQWSTDRDEYNSGNTSEAMAHSYNYGHRTGTGRVGDKGCENEGAAQGQNGERMRNESGNSGSELANTEGISQREPTDKADTKPAERRTRDELGYGGDESLAAGVGQGLERPRNGNICSGEKHAFFAGCSNSEFPARPGEQQHDWEAPRIIESGMGCTIDGYNFREDLLRGLGNGVVEQTAEIAFRDLLRKHGLLNH